MARNQGDVSVTLSVLDRLIDREAGSQVEAPLSRSQSVRLMKSAVRRDLEWLLNTRRIFPEPHESLKEVNRSLYNYGLQDLSSYAIGNPMTRPKSFASCWPRSSCSSRAWGASASFRSTPPQPEFKS